LIPTFDVKNNKNDYVSKIRKSKAWVCYLNHCNCTE